ncbi:subunit Spt3 of histone acetyltransferase PCAF/SAGA complex [Hamiltosporidium tvaerminnensis]|uniref:Subunit Spt3 of PCAF/SAGA histone acetyltransferase complex n=2 Tax=Hamiltosporidium TaxID=1176354 RepID=A0A4Q9LJJ1_9MICR|nr:subunit Spt3 of histone acetyltransferase PCAF/SAGA complex [Hamiltosporidium tvaerminnensis]TBU08036.1 subunit Spt3 of histone acetyltransferase PCAF/SAGA complex [Hamiltosporidium magnivora]TBU08863.1 subunit Spt3 of PCAF/SAGA histone acetyltransferase complex [Hamiltosporidium magnivora]TBU13762.1 subunit Spt3 of histone acetyltransferase PCAF/SAGA complex [Hamiltosporidium tvaerminnensis]TBU20437.1 subunit Spt3 of histone acetyltransferase PCAF/SAGA complex [Hamiltosporidium tvaerminnens
MFYDTEIQSMMFTFGEVKNTNHETIEYIESIIRSNIKSLLSKSRKVQILRKGKYLSVEDICFVLRRKVYMVNRILQFLAFRETRKKINEESVSLYEEKNCEKMEFDWFNHKSEVKDKELIERLRIIDEVTQFMDKEEYLNFCECRQASFTYRKYKKFKEFIEFSNLKDDVIDILGYICYEMVYTLTVNAFKTKKNFKFNKFAKKDLFNFEQSFSLSVKDINAGLFLILKENGSLI